MKKKTLNEVIAMTKEMIKPYQHRPSTLWQYDYAWRGLGDYFEQHETECFSLVLAYQYVTEARQKYEVGNMATWKFKLFRKSVMMLIQCYETGSVQWGKLPSWVQSSFNTSLYNSVIDDYVKDLESNKLGLGTIELRKSVSKKFLGYLEEVRIYSCIRVDFF